MQLSFIQTVSAAALLALSLGGCAHHVRLTSPDTDPGARYVCEGAGQCQPATTDVPSEHNPSGMTIVNLPRQCAGKIHQILILDAGSSKPKVYVTCAPAEESIGTMGSPEARN